MVIGGAMAIAIILAGLFLSGQLPLGQAPETAAAVNLGFSYLTVTPRLAAYYNLGVDYGTLVTEVVIGSQADRAGIKVGDVIVSFNGTRIKEGVPLLGAIRDCPVGEKITIEVWRGKDVLIEELVHTER